MKIDLVPANTKFLEIDPFVANQSAISPFLGGDFRHVRHWRLRHPTHPRHTWNAWHTLVTLDTLERHERHQSHETLKSYTNSQ